MENKELIEEEIVEEVTETVDETEDNDRSRQPSRRRNKRRSSEFAWESLDSVQNSRKNQLIDDIYNMNDYDAKKLEDIKAEWNTLGSEGDDSRLEERFNRAIENQEQRAVKMADAAQKKQALIEEAQSLRDSSEWKKTADRLKDLQKQWKEAGFAGSKLNDELWEKFTAINDAFFARRHDHYQELDALRQTAKEVKLKLIEEAKLLSDSSQWKETSTRLREMMNEWKKVGTAGRDIDDNLWNEFNEARQIFYRRQDEHFETINQTQEHAAAAKQNLVEEARRLANHLDLRSVKIQMDQLLESWKAAGFSGKDKDQNLWNQFNDIRNDYYQALKNAQHSFKADRKEELDNEIDNAEEKLTNLEDLKATLESKITAVLNKPEPAESNPNREAMIAEKEEELQELRRLNDENDRKIEAINDQLDAFHDEWETL